MKLLYYAEFNRKGFIKIVRQAQPSERTNSDLYNDDDGDDDNDDDDD